MNSIHKLFLATTCLVVFLLCSTNRLWAQRIAFVDVDYLMQNNPTVKSMQEQLDRLSEQYQKELELVYNDLSDMKRNFEVEKILLSDDLRLKRQDVILTKEKMYQELSRKYFGPNGDLFKKREELSKAPQEDIINAINAVAERKGIKAVLKKSDLLFLDDASLDISDLVLEQMGLRNN